MDELQLPEATRSVVLVEGASDQLALVTLASRYGIDLLGAGIAVLAIGGATNIGRFLERFGPRGSNLQLAGLYDVAEARYFARGLERVGLGSELSVDDLRALGFHECDQDLEDELIRALGAVEVERIIEREGELASFRILQNQPAQRGRSREKQLQRFFGTKSGRKERYARVLVDGLDLAHVPRPLRGVLDHVRAAI